MRRESRGSGVCAASRAKGSSTAWSIGGCLGGGRRVGGSKLFAEVVSFAFVDADDVLSSFLSPMVSLVVVKAKVAR